jgi:hypothetical protein
MAIFASNKLPGTRFPYHHAFVLCVSYANGACAQLSTHGAVPTSDDCASCMHMHRWTVWTLKSEPTTPNV